MVRSERGKLNCMLTTLKKRRREGVRKQKRITRVERVNKESLIKYAFSFPLGPPLFSIYSSYSLLLTEQEGKGVPRLTTLPSKARPQPSQSVDMDGGGASDDEKEREG